MLVITVTNRKENVKVNVHDVQNALQLIFIFY